MLDDEKMRTYTRGDNCVLLYNKITFYKGVPLCFTFASTWKFIQGSTIIFLKNIMSKILKKEGGLSVGNPNDHIIKIRKIKFMKTHLIVKAVH